MAATASRVSSDLVSLSRRSYVDVDADLVLAAHVGVNGVTACDFHSMIIHFTHGLKPVPSFRQELYFLPNLVFGS